MAIKIPNRVGEGFAGLDRFSSNKANLADCLNQIAANLTAIKAAATGVAYGNFQTSMAAIDVIESSTDSRI